MMKATARLPALLAVLIAWSCYQASNGESNHALESNADPPMVQSGVTGRNGGLERCKALESVSLGDLFGVQESEIRFRASFPIRGTGHILCTAEWESSAGEDRVAAANDDGSIEPRTPRFGQRVSMTISGARFESPQAARSALEKSVEALSSGVTVEADGQEVIAQVGFGGWVELGEGAVFRQDGSLQVAARGELLTFGVLGSNAPGTGRERTLELARRLLAVMPPWEHRPPKARS